VTGHAMMTFLMLVAISDLRVPPCKDLPRGPILEWRLLYNGQLQVGADGPGCSGQNLLSMV
jgi:hypothetical protein